MRWINKTGNQRGFSLIELLISITLLAIGMLALASMQTTAINANGIAKKNSDLTQLAQVALEDILSWNGNDVRLQNATPAPEEIDLDPAGPSKTITLDGGKTYKAVYSLTPDGPAPMITRIDVTVTDLGLDKSLTVTSFKRRE
jgi:type IV pilus assembly protein PilV